MLHHNCPLKINQHLISNRIVVAPMASQTADKEGFVTPATLQHYENLSKSNAGIVMVEYSYVAQTGKSEANQLGVDNFDKLPGLTRLAQAIKSQSAQAVLQIVHGGSKASKSLTGGRLIAPSPLPVPVKGRIMETPDEANEVDIAHLKQAYYQALVIASKAGFDGVEFHSAHGYGLNQWLSPLTNKREDAYGGTTRGRMKLLLDLVSFAKVHYPELLISVRVPGQDHIEGGMTSKEAIEVAQRLEEAGVDLLNVSSGIGGWRRPEKRVGEGYLVADAAQIQRSVHTPVLGVGGIKSKKYIDEQLREGNFAMAVIGRAFLKNPTFLKL